MLAVNVLKCKYLFKRLPHFVYQEWELLHHMVILFSIYWGTVALPIDEYQTKKLSLWLAELQYRLSSQCHWVADVTVRMKRLGSQLNGDVLKDFVTAWNIKACGIMMSFLCQRSCLTQHQWEWLFHTCLRGLTLYCLRKLQWPFLEAVKRRIMLPSLPQHLFASRPVKWKWSRSDLWPHGL